MSALRTHTAVQVQHQQQQQGSHDARNRVERVNRGVQRNVCRQAHAAHNADTTDDVTAGDAMVAAVAAAAAAAVAVAAVAALLLTWLCCSHGFDASLPHRA